MPSLVVVAGSNGSGKSTLTRIENFRNSEIIDPDAIARDMRARATDRVEIAAAREALQRQRATVAAGRSFVVETTLAGQGTLRLMRAAQRAGYTISLHYVCLASPDQSVRRVRNRVARGGHDVPEDDIRRRFTRSLANLPLATALADEAQLHDNSQSREPHRNVAVVNAARRWTAERCPEWAAGAVSAEASIRDEMDRTTERNMPVAAVLTAPGGATET